MQYNIIDSKYFVEFSFNICDMISIQYTVYTALMNSLRFKDNLLNLFLEAHSVYVKTFFEGNNITKDLPELEKVVRRKISNIFDSKFREDFVSMLSDIVADYLKLAKSTGFGQANQNFSFLCANWNNNLIEPIRDWFWRTPSVKVLESEEYSLFRYNRIITPTNDTTVNSTTSNMTPLLMVYAFINRQYILDLLPEVSVVNKLLKQGFDVYATDWGTPSIYHKDLTSGHFINRYMDKSIDLIREITKSDKISLWGYCWGRNLVLIYAALHPEKVKNIVTVATPVDFSLDDILLSVWSKRMDGDILLDA